MDTYIDLHSRLWDFSTHEFKLMWNPKLWLIDVESRTEEVSSPDSVDSVGFSDFLVVSQSSYSSLRSTQTFGLWMRINWKLINCFSIKGWIECGLNQLNLSNEIIQWMTWIFLNFLKILNWEPITNLFTYSSVNLKAKHCRHYFICLWVCGSISLNEIPPRFNLNAV